MGRIGIDHDVVTLTLNSEATLILESYEISLSILQQPGAFSIRLGSNEEARKLIKKYPSNTKFSLAIDGAVQFTGTTDGFVAEGSAGGTELTLRGRDALKPCHDAWVESEKSFGDITYAELVEKVLIETTPLPWVLTHSNAANRKAITKAPRAGGSGKLDTVAAAIALGDVAAGLGDDETLDVSEFFLSDSAIAAKKKTAAAGTSGNTRTLQAKVNQHWWSGFLKPELDRARLMLWATADGNFVLATPATDGAPVARIYRKRGAGTNLVSAKGGNYRNETTGRYAEVVVHYRSGGGRKARYKAFGRFVDEEMVALGYKHKRVIHDEKCKTIAQADFLARKLVAESRRAGWSLDYPMAGHTTVGLDNTRIIWGDDCIVEVDDDEFDVRGQFYVESVSHRGGPEKSSMLKLMRKADVIYGEEFA